jgi:exonuclease III
MNIAFWNIKNNEEIYDTIIELIKQFDIDILLLAESPLGIFTDLKKHPRFNNFVQVSDGDSKVEVYSRVFKQNFKSILDAKRWTGYEIDIPQRLKINLFAVHFPSKVNWSEDSLALECVNFANDIKSMETKVGHKNSVLIGDFNMNPFEAGILSANGLNAIQDLLYSKTAKGRVVNDNHHDFFYNPMWNFFGDYKKPLGTHYHRNSGNVSNEWSILDQIIIRPDLSDLINKDSIKIISKIKKVDLGRYFNRPNDKEYSDHYPILINLNI